MNTRPPTMMGIPTPESRAVWTNADESKFIELQQRRERIMAENRSRVLEVIYSFMPNDTPVSFLAPMIDGMIGNAPAMRDALAPFDGREGK